jgi:hypothetical protein
MRRSGITPDLRIANGKIQVLWTTKKHASFVISPNKHAAANEILSVTNYDRERPILTKFVQRIGNGGFEGHFRVLNCGGREARLRSDFDNVKHDPSSTFVSVGQSS